VARDIRGGLLVAVFFGGDVLSCLFIRSASKVLSAARDGGASQNRRAPLPWMGPQRLARQRRFVIVRDGWPVPESVGAGTCVETSARWQQRRSMVGESIEKHMHGEHDSPGGVDFHTNSWRQVYPATTRRRAWRRAA